ncbi:nck-associated protein 5-like [Chanos chanos]|uniref:Nck-associated protein 5-like n=1 Tax=Chanos chanos TaxID=29144 RepID=A0A6J2VTB3_CHACN|nr:nck-associated protein 5-like [Chanos chanos]
MSEGAELRECDEAFESEEGDVDPFLEEEEEEEEEETESSRELLERLRELEAENSALALANESQREAYERCLDEVANHVVQALLNQKDLREECIKLKMRVFDLERQNRTLTELFTQKLHTQVNPSQQLPTASCPEHNSESLVTSTEQFQVSHSLGEAKNNGDRTQIDLAGPTRAPASSMEALSPFFKKKAHILEVLRKLEESDPLKFHPSSCLSYHSQALLSGEMGSMATSSQRQPHCRHSSSDSDIHEYANGEGMLQDNRVPSRHGGCPSCRILSQKNSLDRLLKGSHGPGLTQSGREENMNSQRWSEEQGASAQSTDQQVKVSIVGDTNHTFLHSTKSDHLEHRGAKAAHLSDPNAIASGLYHSALAEGSEPNTDPGSAPRNMHPLKERAPDKSSHVKPLSEGLDDTSFDVDHTETALPSNQDSAIRPDDERCYLEVVTDTVTEVKRVSESTEQVCNGVYFSTNETSVSKKVAVESYSPTPVPERTSSASHQPQAAGKSKFAHSPTSPSSCLSEAKPSPISSPSKLLKFLKIPSIGDRAQTANALRLSPQLTRSSKIPCRNNNYEVYHSPILSRKATTTERDRQSVPSSKTDTYPGTHSAPTSPPKPEDNCPSIPIKETGYHSHSAPKPSRSSLGAPQSSLQSQRGSQKVPHYENISDTPDSCPVNGLSQFHPYSQREVTPADKQQINLKEEKLCSPPSKNSDSSGTTGESPSDPSDEDTDTESPVWQKPQQHFSLPTSSSASNKAQRTSYSSMKERHHERVPQDPVSVHTRDPSLLAQANTKKSDRQPSLPKRTVSNKPQSDSSHHPFKERLAALGKLKSSEDLQQPLEKKEGQSNISRAVVSTGNSEKSKTAERQGERSTVEPRHTKYTDSLDGKPYPKTSLGSYAKVPGPPFLEQSNKSMATPSTSVNKGELETLSQRVYVAKVDGPKIKMGMSSTTSTETPVVMRNYGKFPNPHTHHSKTVPSPQSSPTKVPSKSPSKAGQASSYPRGVKPVQDERSHPQRQLSRTEDKSKLTAGKKKTSIHTESFPPPPPPRPPMESAAHANVTEEKKPLVAAPGPQSSIEQKVMRGIEENVLKLQEQDRGQGAETKQKASNGIASWFGLKKSKLPALSRKPEVSKLKINMSSSSSSSGTKDPKPGPRKVVESLNISKLMEKAEDLRKALEEERAFVNGVGVGMGVALDRPGRGHSCEVVMDQAQGQLSLMYRGVTADNFMQQLLNRVDEKGAASFGMAHRRLSFDSKRSRPVFAHQRNGISHNKSREEMDKGSDMVSRDEVTSDESLAESISSQHFTGSGASMRTLDSGIGTFPLPDYASSAAGKSIPKPQGEQGFTAPQGKHGGLMKIPRKARTLERELSSLEEVNPAILYGSPMEDKGPSMHLSSTIHEDIDAYGARTQTPPAKNWTCPNLKGSAGSTDVYLGMPVEVEPSGQGTPSRRSLMKCAPQGTRETDPGSLPLPPQMGLSRRAKGRTPGPDMPKEGGLELVKERPDDILSPSRPQALETPESLSDSLYDSLSSCGSQG